MWLECGGRWARTLRLIADPAPGLSCQPNPFGVGSIAGFRRPPMRFPQPAGQPACRGRTLPGRPLARQRRAISCWISPLRSPYQASDGAGVRFRQPGVDKARTGGLYTPNTGRRRLGAMARPRSSSLIFGDQPPIKSRRFGASTALRAIRGGGPPVPGCLTSESEERETWTAESLRTAASGGAIHPGGGRWKRLRRYTFQVNTVITRVIRVGPRQTL